MSVDELRSIIHQYEYLQNKAGDILSEGNITYDGVDYVAFDEKRNIVEIGYTAFRRETYHDSERVPAEWFEDGIDLKGAWCKKREADRRTEEKHVKEEKRREAREKRKAELAELARLKAKYESEATDGK